MKIMEPSSFQSLGIFLFLHMDMKNVTTRLLAGKENVKKIKRMCPFRKGK